MAPAGPGAPRDRHAHQPGVPSAGGTCQHETVPSRACLDIPTARAGHTPRRGPRLRTRTVLCQHGVAPAMREVEMQNGRVVDADEVPDGFVKILEGDLSDEELAEIEAAIREAADE